MSATIRAPRSDELELLRDIEWAAGAIFVDVGFPDVAADEPLTAEALAGYANDGRAWVVTDDRDTPVGYAIVDIVDGLAHLEQLSVRPDHGRQGLGAALLDHVAQWAAQHEREAVTLTTFREVPWNAPFYAKHGYRVMSDAEIGPELETLRAQEAEHGLDPAQRVCMRRDI
ncbi:MAG TPA: GNAT family N-acetyltransferase [Acidimicrobiia bacterium]|nr:GNAT family N-acetyltransferase [Acidimicrobiia bacterium]